MANGRLSALAKRRARAAKAKYWQHVTALLSQRDQLIDEILVCSRARTPSPFIKKASALLTRFWARADWKSREEILRAARWLVEMGRYHAPSTSKKAGVRKAGQRGKAASVGNPKQGRPASVPARREIEANAG